MGRRAVRYVRVTTSEQDSQRQSDDIDAAMAEDDYGYESITTWADIESGKNDKREDCLRMCDEIEGGEYDVLFVDE